MTNYFIIAGLVLLGAGIWSTRYVHRAFECHAFSAGWRVARIASVLMGLAFGFYCFFFLTYQVSPTVRIHGFPFPVGVYELRRDQWAGTGGGSFGLSGIVGDTLFGYFALQMILATSIWVYLKRQRALRPD